VDVRVEQLASATGVSVDTIRFYQSRGLLPPPRREGRVGWYTDEHRSRIERIKDLQAKGLTLATIRRLLSGELDAADEALVTALSSEEGGAERFDLAGLAERSGIPIGLLQAVEREGLLMPERGGYTAADVAVARAGLALLEEGLPLSDILDLARRHHQAMLEVAEQAVLLFDEHVRQPLRTSTLPDEAAAERLVAAFQRLLPATSALVAHHFTRTLLAVAQDHIEQVGEPAELRAVLRAADAT
jgi:DNA-binding transcriptional MerR regulator